MIDVENKKVCIVGMGYVGLTLAVVMAECGFDVLGVEINPETVERLRKGKAHFYELGLQSRLARQVKLGNLVFETPEAAQVAKECRVFILTVGTPLNDQGNPRMDMVERATNYVKDVMPEDSLIILRSTVRLGTSRNVVQPILKSSGKVFKQAYCPERTIEGKALEELRSLPQIVGGMDEESTWRAARLFQRLTPTTVRVSGLETAEVIKLLDNSFRDLFFAFGNEVAMLCDAAGLDGIEVIKAANTGYERTNIAKPGFVGGPCLEKDPHILQHSLCDFDFTPQLIHHGRKLNEELPVVVSKSILEWTSKHNVPADMKLTICGLAFKGRPETDDLRGTPAKLIIKAVQDAFPKAKIYGQDFAVKDEDIRTLGIEPASAEQAFDGSSVVIIANNHLGYSRLDYEGLSSTMRKQALIFDCWDCISADGQDFSDGVTYLRFGSVKAWGNKA